MIYMLISVAGSEISRREVLDEDYEKGGFSRSRAKII
jgi:hypothetical protein